MFLYENTLHCDGIDRWKRGDAFMTNEIIVHNIFVFANTMHFTTSRHCQWHNSAYVSTPVNNHITSLVWLSPVRHYAYTAVCLPENLVVGFPVVSQREADQWEGARQERAGRHVRHCPGREPGHNHLPLVGHAVRYRWEGGSVHAHTVANPATITFPSWATLSDTDGTGKGGGVSTRTHGQHSGLSGVPGETVYWNYAQSSSVGCTIVQRKKSVCCI